MDKYEQWIKKYEAKMRKILGREDGLIFQLEYEFWQEGLFSKNKVLQQVLASVHDEESSREEKAKILEACYDSSFEDYNV